VIETDGVTWVEVATGRRSWSEAVDSGAIRVSGNRTDLSAYLPLPGYANRSGADADG
jgi:hypothetical protein